MLTLYIPLIKEKFCLVRFQEASLFMRTLLFISLFWRVFYSFGLALVLFFLFFSFSSLKHELCNMQNWISLQSISEEPGEVPLDAQTWCCSMIILLDFSKQAVVEGQPFWANVCMCCSSLRDYCYQAPGESAQWFYICILRSCRNISGAHLSSGCLELSQGVIFPCLNKNCIHRF